MIVEEVVEVVKKGQKIRQSLFLPEFILTLKKRSLYIVNIMAFGAGIPLIMHCLASERIRSLIDTGHYLCGIFVDLEKAFDTVNHRIL